MRNIDDQFED